MSSKAEWASIPSSLRTRSSFSRIASWLEASSSNRPRSCSFRRNASCRLITGLSPLLGRGFLANRKDRFQRSQLTRPYPIEVDAEFEAFLRPFVPRADAYHLARQRQTRRRGGVRLQTQADGRADLNHPVGFDQSPGTADVLRPGRSLQDRRLRAGTVLERECGAQEGLRHREAGGTAPLAEGRNDAVLPSRLGGVKRLVRSREEDLQITAVDGEAREPAADRQIEARPRFARREPLLDAAPDALSDRRRSVLRCLGKQHRELLSPVTGCDVNLPDRPYQQLRNLAEHPVAVAVSESVVGLLEIVEIEKEKRSRQGVSSRAPQLRVGADAEAPAIRQPRQRVGDGQPF